VRFLRFTNHPIAQWWSCVDRFTLLGVLLLMGFGAAISFTASTGVASDFNVDSFYFARRQIIFLFGGLGVMLTMSLLSLRGVITWSFMLFALALAGMVGTLFMGAEVKGAQRWVDVAGFRLQPSELMKPSFVIITAWLMSHPDAQRRLHGFFVSLGLLGVMTIVLMLQPDFGMFVMLSGVWFGQMFLASLAPTFLAGLLLIVAITASMGYVLLPHVRSRLSRFLDPANSDTYQVDHARQAFVEGGFFGRGPGEGVVKHALPDAHTDFVFAVIGEEFGLITCLIVLAVYGFILMRSFTRIVNTEKPFVALAGSGLLLLFGGQVVINTGVALSLMPTTGMTLPFISYGGSSMLSMSILMGFVLALTRTRRDGSVKKYRP
tara:strand:- start:129259 stop:130389 length:1131 start_codon:yes stop_codon:yes gene_type:complete